jgi:hypothetical protein
VVVSAARYSVFRPVLIAYGLTLDEAAAMLRLESEDVLYAIETAGRCDGLGDDGCELIVIEEGES